MSPKQQRGEATVGRLLTTALRAYEECGPQGFTVTAVTAAGGVSLGSPYHHFGSFDGLAAALYFRCAERLHGEVVIALAPTRTGHAGVRAVVTAYLRFAGEQRDAALFLHSRACPGRGADAGRVGTAGEPLLAAIGVWARPFVETGEIAAVPEPVIGALVVGPAAETVRRRQARRTWISPRRPGSCRTASGTPSSPADGRPVPRSVSPPPTRPPGPRREP
ncbi:TetR/AcrR family transcriptional regulator [Streptomyces sp. NPDC001728]|uniref:TetR/AcrR family transcriptional regulator n=1 Tax=Streptomyces sp. NPDC001728 TaxID=3154396 RepID=UPI0033319B48